MTVTTNDDSLRTATGTLEAALSGALSAEVTDLRRLSGGASRETWAFTATDGDGARELILRRNPPAERDGSALMLEQRAMVAAGRAGMAVPEVVLTDPTGQHLERPAVVMTRLPGEALPSRILRSADTPVKRRELLRSAVHELALLHAIPVPDIEGLVPEDVLRYWGEHLHGLTRERPVLELALSWLEAHVPPVSSQTVVHGDFRMGNLLVDEGVVSGILDWELVHAGDPLEDLGWLCTKAWRFDGSTYAAGGTGTYAELVEDYEELTGTTVDPGHLHWWEVLSTFKWGVMCVQQYQRHARGIEPSLELASLGWRTAEAEWDLLYLLSGSSATSLPAAFDEVQPVDLTEPRTFEMLDAVVSTLREHVIGRTEGREDFYVRVVARLCASMAREMRLGHAYDELVATRLADLGVASTSDLADRLRGAPWDDAAAEALTAVLRDLTAATLTFRNPRYLARPFPPRLLD